METKKDEVNEEKVVVAIETKTPVPIETPESPQAVTPVPEPVEESHGNCFYYIPINDTTFKLSVFLPSDTESRINELRFSDSVSLSFKTRLKSVTFFCGDAT